VSARDASSVRLRARRRPARAVGIKRPKALGLQQQGCVGDLGTAVEIGASIWETAVCDYPNWWPGLANSVYNSAGAQDFGLRTTVELPRKFDLLGRSQVVRHRILIPANGGSNPPAPARPFDQSITQAQIN
jgi:hypothetical protein